LHGVEAWSSDLNEEVSLIQGCPLRGFHCVAFTLHGSSSHSHGGALSGCKEPNGPDVLDPLLLAIAVVETLLCSQQAYVFCCARLSHTKGCRRWRISVGINTLMRREKELSQ